jgi:hypothetical protein
MSNKSRTRKHVRQAMSPLLRALTFNRAAHEPVTQAMLLQAYATLDAFRRGYGSAEMLRTLNWQLLMAEELCRLRYCIDELPGIEAALAEIAEIGASEKATGALTISEIGYSRLCDALSIFDRQLSEASLGDIAKTESRVASGLMRDESTVAVAAALSA